MAAADTPSLTAVSNVTLLDSPTMEAQQNVHQNGSPNGGQPSRHGRIDDGHSDTALFTADVDVLPVGKQLQIIGSSCAVTAFDTVRCETQGNHGFVLSAETGEFW